MRGKVLWWQHIEVAGEVTARMIAQHIPGHGSHRVARRVDDAESKASYAQHRSEGRRIDPRLSGLHPPDRGARDTEHGRELALAQVREPRTRLT